MTAASSTYSGPVTTTVGGVTTNTYTLTLSLAPFSAEVSPNSIYFNCGARDAVGTPTGLFGINPLSRVLSIPDKMARTTKVVWRDNWYLYDYASPRTATIFTRRTGFTRVVIPTPSPHFSDTSTQDVLQVTTNHGFGCDEYSNGTAFSIIDIPVLMDDAAQTVLEGWFGIKPTHISWSTYTFWKPPDAGQTKFTKIDAIGDAPGVHVDYLAAYPRYQQGLLGQQIIGQATHEGQGSGSCWHNFLEDSSSTGPAEGKTVWSLQYNVSGRVSPIVRPILDQTLSGNAVVYYTGSVTPPASYTSRIRVRYLTYTGLDSYVDHSSPPPYLLGAYYYNSGTNRTYASFEIAPQLISLPTADDARWIFDIQVRIDPPVANTTYYDPKDFTTEFVQFSPSRGSTQLGGERVYGIMANP